MPLFGSLLRRMHVLVNRDNPRQAARALLKMYNRAKNESRHIVLFPEGTRSRDGKLQPFLGGFAILAKKLDRPVIPVAINGAFGVMTPGKWIINPLACDVVVTVGKPMYIKFDESSDAFASRIHAWFS
jgi:1-acyl-sn-glycerol-3-phosphate acyltransferase